MSINRQQFAEELALREMIQKAIKVVKKRRTNEKKGRINEEKELRRLIRRLIVETETPEPEDAPHKSTGINVLEDLLKKIIPILEIDFKKLTTSEGQRKSFRAHVIQAVTNTLSPARVTDLAGTQPSLDEQDVSINVGEEDPDEFIDIGRKQDKKEELPQKDAEKEDFSISGEDETGRDMAFSSFKRIEANIVDSWEILSDADDKELFYDYLITNLKLYFDKFEDELQTTVPEPTTPEYEEEIETTEEPTELGSL